MPETFTPYVEGGPLPDAANVDAYLPVRVPDGPRRHGYVIAYLPDGAGLEVNGRHLLRLRNPQTRRVIRSSARGASTRVLRDDRLQGDAVAHTPADVDGRDEPVVHAWTEVDVRRDGPGDTYLLGNSSTETES